MIDFRIKTFLMLCETGSYTKTAEKLLMTQPAVSQHIRYLEQQYDCKLFIYQGKTLSITPQGKLLREYAVTVEADSKRIPERLARSKHKQVNRKFGATLTIREFCMPPVTEALLRGKIPFRLYIENTETLLRMLELGEIDFAFVEGQFPKDAYSHALFATEPFAAVCAPENPLAHRDAVTLEDLLSQPLILREKGSGTREIFETYLTEHGYQTGTFPYLAQLGSISLIKQAVMKNYGVTFLYRRAAEKELKSGSLQILPLIGFPLYREFHFVFLKDSIFAPEYMDFFAFCKECR